MTSLFTQKGTRTSVTPVITPTSRGRQAGGGGGSGRFWESWDATSCPAAQGSGSVRGQERGGALRTGSSACEHSAPGPRVGETSGGSPSRGGKPRRQGWTRQGDDGHVWAELEQLRG